MLCKNWGVYHLKIVVRRAPRAASTCVALPHQASVFACRVPEECPADVENIIARCLDSDPDKRPSARELVEFMVQLPQQFSLDGTGRDGSNELSSSETQSSPGYLLAPNCCSCFDGSSPGWLASGPVSHAPARFNTAAVLAGVHDIILCLVTSFSPLHDGLSRTVL